MNIRQSMVQAGYRASFRPIALGVTLLISAYLFGALSYSRNFWPIEILRQLKASAEAQATMQGGSPSQFDSLGRFTFYSGKQQVDCPLPGTDTGVLLVIGQSNAGNHAQQIFTNHYITHVVNYFNGRCYVASSPLLGASGDGGEFLTPLADELIATGTYKNVVIVAAAVGGSPISRWVRDGDLNESLIALVKDVQRQFPITEVIWNQGEMDAAFRTSEKVYVSSFRSLVATLTEQGVKAPLFMSIATRWCNTAETWAEDNPVAIAQRLLINNKTIFLGVDTDRLVEPKDRDHNCHFAESGQSKTAKALADSIRAAKNHTNL
jgi:hypothetical protein